ncbi:nitroreductase family protein [Ileibacterium valens]|uniref:nitroreductase family protein n=1 Tax=Ileibacterium valens TaxID=1862668 RepID=UPI00259B3F7D|nr:nitroreductase family protein [Ileibacterium valens]
MDKNLFTRRSIRKYTDQPVPNAMIEDILKAAMAAPTAVNDKQWLFYVVENPELKKQLADSSPYSKFAAEAPVIIVLGYNETEGNAPEFCQINMALVSENLMVEAENLGLGTVMLGVAPHEDRMECIEKILNMKNGERAFAMFPIGYPDQRPADKHKADMSRVFWM